MNSHNSFLQRYRFFDSFVEGSHSLVPAVCGHGVVDDGLGSLIKEHGCYSNRNGDEGLLTRDFVIG